VKTKDKIKIIKNFKTMQGIAKMTLKTYSSEDCYFMYDQYAKLAMIYSDAMRKKQNGGN